MISWFEQRQVYVPSTWMEACELDCAFEDVYFTSRDGVRLNGWFMPAPKNSARARLVILLMHGNAGNLSHRASYYQAWLELGLNVFAFDYRGFGRSAGRPSEEGTYLDAQAAHEWLRQKGFAPTEILALGKSLGGGVASELALRETIGGLILQNTFTSIPDIGSEMFPWLPVRRLHRIKYDTLAKLPRIHVPVLVAHSRIDQTIGFHHGERNFAAANEPKMFWEIAGGHTGTIEVGRARYLEGLKKFLVTYFTSHPMITNP